MHDLVMNIGWFSKVVMLILKIQLSFVLLLNVLTISMDMC
jgi:hypothetical protein